LCELPEGVLPSAPAPKLIRDLLANRVQLVVVKRHRETLARRKERLAALCTKLRKTRLRLRAVSDATVIVGRMVEGQSAEIESTLLYIAEARERAARARRALEADGASQYLLDALHVAEAELESSHRTLMQGTLFRAPDAQKSLSV
jgi:hypothetical protein